MWQVVNQTPFPAEGQFLRDGTGQSFWSVWVASAFRLRAGKMPLFVAEQEGPSRGPVFRNDDPEDLLLRDADIAPLRERVDLILTGSAERPVEKPKAILARIGGWEKRIWLQPVQRWGRRGKAVDEAETGPERVELTYHAAFGGPGFADNPLGTGHGDRAGKVRPVALTPTADAQAAPGRAMPVAGFGAVPRTWPKRARLAGTYDLAWQEGRAPLLPEDFDPAYWQAAPADQQLQREAVADGAVLELGGFTGCGPAETPTAFRLPIPELEMSTRVAGQWLPGDLALQSVMVDVDKLLVRMCYQAVWPLVGTAKDVTFDTTVVAMGSAKGFRVRPVDAAVFGRSRAVPEVAT
jgi:hypothetical protein